MQNSDARLLKEARASLEERDWPRAEERFAQLAEHELEAGGVEGAEEAFGAAADAAYRADLPLRACQHLERAANLEEQAGELASLRAVQRAGALIELGQLELADSLLTRVLDLARSGSVRSLALDTAVGLDLLRGQLGRARAHVVELEREEFEGSEPSLLYRTGQISRYEGRLCEAVDALSACAILIENEERYHGPLGATLLELAEVALMRHDFDDAQGLLDMAEGAWGKARRRSGLHRVEAARMRLLFLSGAIDLFTRGLEKAIAFSVERHLRVLEAELRLARGYCLRGRDPQAAAEQLRQANALAREIGALPICGQSALALHDQPAGSRRALEQACRDLVELPVWRSRAYLALARVMAREPSGRKAAIEICTSALCRFSVMDLPSDEQSARNLIWRLSAVRG